MRPILGVICVVMLVSANAFGQEFPNRNIDFIVPYSPGGGSDNLVRSLQPSLENALGETIVIRNISGGGGAVGYSRLLRAEPDGYSITTTNNAIFTLSSFSNAPFVNEDFDHLASVAVI
ncbi:MAG: tripartite tricarboxylate transporter substrate-binding protein, partial [Pseudomonadales bacterium]